REIPENGSSVSSVGAGQGLVADELRRQLRGAGQPPFFLKNGRGGLDHATLQGRRSGAGTDTGARPPRPPRPVHAVPSYGARRNGRWHLLLGLSGDAR